MELLEYLYETGRSPFALWFDDLDPVAAAKVSVALARMGVGNLSNVKGVGGGVLEFRIDFGPGYRIYSGRDGDRLIILLAGGTKQRQDENIVSAKEPWADYKKRK